MHDFLKDEVSEFAPGYKVKDAFSGAADADLVVVYKADNPLCEVSFLAKFLKEGVNP